jgi:phosphoribosylaminoimidazole-succinocarboxamide synthase
MEYAARGFCGDGEPPVMLDSLWAAAGERYIQIYEMLTGQAFIPGLYPAGPRLETNLRKEGLLR